MNLDVNTLLKLEGICKAYPMGNRSIVALKNICLRILKGEFVSVLGPSGSGKSTLLTILGLLSKPTEGRFYFEDHLVSDLNERKRAALRNQKIGFVFQSFHLLSSITALENVEVPLIYQRMGLRDRRRRALEALEMVGMISRRSHLPRQLSGGECQRVAIARALVINPMLVLADEPTGNLDTRTGLEILRILKTLNSKGVTLIVVTHDASIAQEAQRRIFLQDGRIDTDQYINNQELSSHKDEIIHSSSR